MPSSPRRFHDCLDILREEFELLTGEIHSMKKQKDELEAIIKSQREELERIRRSIDSLLCQSRSLEDQVVTPQQTYPSVPEHIDAPKPPGAMNQISVDTTTAISGTSTVRPDSGPEEGEQCLITFNDKVEKELDVEIMHTLSHEYQISRLCFSRDGKFLAAGCTNGRTYIYDVETGTLTCVLRNLLDVVEHKLINIACFGHDGKYLATASDDMKIYIWEINTKYVRNVFKGHSGYILSIEFSPNGSGLLVSASADNSVRLWNMRYGAEKVFTGDNDVFLDYEHYTPAVFSPDGRFIAAPHCDKMIRIWAVRTGQLIRRVKAHMDWVIGIAFMPDGKGLVSGSRDGTLKYWDVNFLDTRICARSRTTDGSHRDATELETRPERVFLGHGGCISSVATSPDGRWIASGSQDQSVRIWDARGLTAVVQCTINNVQGTHTLDFSPAGSYFASGSSTIRIWRYSYSTVHR